MKRHTQLVAVKPMGAMGRVLIPADVRRLVGLVDGTRVKIHLGDDFLVLEAERVGDKLCPTCGRSTERPRRPSDD